MDPAQPARRRPRRRTAALGEPLLAPAAILEGLPDAVVASTPDGRIVFVNARAEALFGYTREELLGQPVEVLWPERLRGRYTRNMRQYFATEHPLRFSTEAWGLRRDGSEFAGEMSWGVVETDAGSLLLAIGRDVSERRAREARLRAVAAMGERALAGADPAVLAQEAAELLRTSLPVAAASVRLAGDPAPAAPDVPERLRIPIGEGADVTVLPLRPLTHEELGIVRAVAGTLASALARRREEERMRHDAMHDPLTGLPNRALLLDRLRHALARTEREGGDTGVLFVDLDAFKAVNDRHGHAAGDAVLVGVADRLRGAVRPADTVTRLGGDEFVVLCDRVDRPGLLALASRLERAVRRPLQVAGAEGPVTASIGMALGRGDADALLAAADAAVYRAKAAGGGRVEAA
jgi:diguanylate cyclase (GGDEF)-like protein/PAS domain S-box-containing protein